MTFLQRLLRVFDRISDPIFSYPNNTYIDQIRTYNAFIKTGRFPFLAFLRIVKIAFQLAAGILMTPVSAILRLMGFRFVSIDLSQVGSITYLDLLLRENRLGLCTPRHKLFVSRSTFLDSNAYALDLYRPYLTCVKNPFLKLAFFPFFMNPFFKENTYRFDCSEAFKAIEGEQRTFVHKIWRDHDERFGAPLVSLGEEEVALGRDMMAPLLPVGRKFVALHVRDSGFYGDTHRVTRNADVNTYEPAIRYLIDRGYAVVRMGDANMVGIDDMIARCGPDLIDYALSDLRSDFLDCYLCSECDFFIGLASGLLSLPIVFGRPSCIVNYYNATTGLGFLASDLTTFKKFRYISDDSLVPFDQLMRPPFSQSPQLKTLEAVGAYMEDNNAEEILAAVKEFIERDGIDPTPLQKAARDMVLKSNYCYSGRGQFSNTILRLYFPDIEGDR